VKTIWVHRDICSPPAILWGLLTEPKYWPEWGPTVQGAEFMGDRLRKGTRGTVTTAFGLRLPFEITSFDEGVRWSWKVAGVHATDHTVEPVDRTRCRVGFGVPWPATPYLAVCRVALDRLDTIAARETANA